MSIENNLKTLADNSERIANALEAIAANFTATTVPQPPAAMDAAPEAVSTGQATPPAATQQTAPQPPAQTDTQPPAQTAAPVPPVTQEQPTTPATTAGLMTDTDMNNILVAEFKRIGDRGPIDAVITELGVTGVAGLSVEVQQQLINKVKAIASAS